MLDCKSSSQSPTSGGNRDRDGFSSPGQHLCRHVGACLTLVCTACSTTAGQVKDPTTTFECLMRKKHNGLRHEKAQIKHNSNGIIKMMSVAIPDRRRTWQEDNTL